MSGDYPKYDFDYWSDQLERSQTHREKHLETSTRSIKAYTGETYLPNTERRMGIYWSLVNTLLPAFFSRVPKVDVELRNKLGNQMAQLAGQIWQHSTQTTIEQDFPFKVTAMDSIMQYILTGEGVLWARYEGQIQQKVEVLTYMRGELEPEAEKKATQVGQFFQISEQVPEKVGEKAILDSIHYKDYRTSVCKNENEIEWKAKRNYLTKERVKQIFGDDIADEASYSAYPEDAKMLLDSGEKPKEGGKAEFWEIWCKSTGKVYFLHNGGPGGQILEQAEPPIKYEGFFPCVVIKANQQPNSCVGFPDFSIIEDMLIEIERLTTRIHATIEAIRTNIAYDSDMGELLRDMLDGDLKMVPANLSNAQKIRNGVAGAMMPLPIELYIRALEVLINSRDKALEKLYEVTGVGELLRGQSTPVKTATANQLEANFTTLRFSMRKEEVVEFLTDAIKKIGEIIAQQFEMPEIYKRGNGEALITEIATSQGLPPAAPEMVFQAFGPIYQLLQNDAERPFKLSLESDSLVEIDQKAERKERTDAMTSIGGFLQQLDPMIEKYPEMASFAAETVKFVARSYKAGKELEAGAVSALNMMAQRSQAKAQDPQAQQPDPKQIEAQARMQIAQMQAQTENQKLQIQMAEIQQRSQLEQIKAQAKANLDQQTLALEAEKAQIEMSNLQLEAQLKSQELQLKAAEIELKKQELEVSAVQRVDDQLIKHQKQELETIVQQQKIAFDKHKLELEMYEKLLEERRLAIQQGANQIRPIEVKLQTTKRTGKISKDALGNSIIEVE